MIAPPNCGRSGDDLSYIGIMEPIQWNVEEDDELSAAAMRHKMERLVCIVTRYIYPPGTVFPPHTHTVDKIDGVLCGCFRVTIEDETVILGAGDMVAVPKGIRHSAEVVGDEPVVSLDGIRGR